MNLNSFSDVTNVHNAVMQDCNTLYTPDYTKTGYSEILDSIANFLFDRMAHHAAFTQQEKIDYKGDFLLAKNMLVQSVTYSYEDILRRLLMPTVKEAEFNGFISSNEIALLDQLFTVTKDYYADTNIYDPSQVAAANNQIQTQLTGIRQSWDALNLDINQKEGLISGAMIYLAEGSFSYWKTVSNTDVRLTQQAALAGAGATFGRDCLGGGISVGIDIAYDYLVNGGLGSGEKYKYSALKGGLLFSVGLNPWVWRGAQAAWRYLF